MTTANRSKARRRGAWKRRALALCVLFVVVAALGWCGYGWWAGGPLAEARKAFARQEWVRAIGLAMPVLASRQCEQEARLLIARSMMRVGNDQDAEALYQQLPISEQSNEDLIDRARALSRLRRWSGTSELYQELHQRDPANGEWLQKFAVSEFQLGKIEHSLELAQKLMQYPAYGAGAYWIHGTIMQLQGKQEQAAESLAKVLELDPDGKTLPVSITRVVGNLVASLSSSDRHDEAERYLKQAIAKEPTAELMASWGRLLATKGDAAAARKQWLATLQLDKRQPDALFGLGQLALSEKQAAEALGWLRLALESGSENPRLHYLLSQAYKQLDRIELSETHALEHRRLTERQEQLARQELAVLQQPTNQQGLLIRAQHAIEKGQWLEAEGILLDMQRRSVLDERAKQMLALVRGQLGR